MNNGGNEDVFLSFEVGAYSSLNLLKGGQSNITRVSFLNDIMSFDYSADMNSGMAFWISSLIAPGEILCDLDFSDLTSDSREPMAIAGLMSYLMFMYDENACFSTIDRQSLINLQCSIVAWGQKGCGVDPSVRSKLVPKRQDSSFDNKGYDIQHEYKQFITNASNVAEAEVRVRYLL